MTGRYQRCLNFMPEMMPVITEYTGFTMKNSNMQNAIPEHSGENLATIAGRRYMIANEVAITRCIVLLLFVVIDAGV